MKKCNTCKTSKKLSDFNKNSSKKDGLQGHCRDCQKKKSKKFYRENKVSQRKSIKKNQKRRIKEAKDFIYKYLIDHPCKECGENDPVVLEFDHLKDKKKSVCFLTQNGYSISSIKKEIEKCQVLCANCHRRKTAKEFEHWKHVYEGV